MAEQVPTDLFGDQIEWDQVSTTLTCSHDVESNWRLLVTMTRARRRWSFSYQVPAWVPSYRILHAVSAALMAYERLQCDSYTTCQKVLAAAIGQETGDPF